MATDNPSPDKENAEAKPPENTQKPEAGQQPAGAEAEKQHAEVSDTEQQPAAKEAGKKPAEPAEPVKKKEVTAQDLLNEEVGAIKIRKAKGSKNVASGIVNVLATFNNTKVSISDQKGNVISWSSAGKMNFRGSRKSTAYAAQVVTQNAARAAMAHGLKEVVVHVNGPGMGRDSAIRALQALGLDVVSIVDTTPVPHNGCRPPKRRRV